MSESDPRTQYGKKVLFGLGVIVVVAVASRWLPAENRSKASVVTEIAATPAPAIGPSRKSVPKRPSGEGIGLGELGIKWPALPDVSLDEWDIPALLMAIKFPDPLPDLNREHKSWLRADVLQLCAVGTSVTSPVTGQLEDRNFSTTVPVWQALQTYYPSILKAKTSKPLVTDDQVSIFALYEALGKNAD